MGPPISLDTENKPRQKIELSFPCHYCPIKCIDLCKYALHVEDIHLGCIYICNTCNKTFKGKMSWFRHNSKEHASECAFTRYVAGTTFLPTFNWQDYHWIHKCCPVCLKEIGSWGEMYHHHEEFHKGRIFVCEECKEEFTSHTDLPAHSLYSHEGKAFFKFRYPNREIEKFVCKICNEEIKKGFNEHHAQHHGETSFICVNCGFLAANIQGRIRHKADHEDCWKFIALLSSNKYTPHPRPIDLVPTPPPSSAEDRMLLTLFTERESITLSDIFEAETEETADENRDNAKTDKAKDRSWKFPTSFLTLPCTFDSTNTSTASPSTSSSDTHINPDPSPSAIGPSDTVILASTTASTTAIDNIPDPTLPSTNDPSTSSSTSFDYQVETLTMIKSKRTFSCPKPADGDGLNVSRKIAFMLRTITERKNTNKPTFQRNNMSSFLLHTLSTSAHDEVETTFSTSRPADGDVSRKIACMLGNGTNRISTNEPGIDCKISFPSSIRNSSIRPRQKSPSSGQVSRVQISKSQSSTEVTKHESAINLTNLKMEVEVETKPVAPLAAVNQTFDDVRVNQSFGDIKHQYAPVKESSNDITASSGATSATATATSTETTTSSSPDRKDSKLLSQCVPRVSLERLDLYVNAIVKIENQERLSSQSVPPSSSGVSDGRQPQRIALIHSVKQELQQLNYMGDEVQYANKTNINKTINNSNSIHIKEEPNDEESYNRSCVISSNSINNARTNDTPTNIGEIKKENVQVNHSNHNKRNKYNNHKKGNNHCNQTNHNRDNVVTVKEPSGPLENSKTWSRESGASSSSSSTSSNAGVRSPRVDEESTRMSCCICFQAFPINLDSYRLHLVDHMKDYEGKSICPVCFVDCTEYDKMVDHFLLVHGKVCKLVCWHSTCVKSFKTRKDLDFHARTHQASYVNLTRP